ncbi:restriction endonuclease subunit S [Pseudomonas moorei]|uniref:restriction endonuclease subunit S n=1 Tax=Pseudomonas moorei TaxID=395599 RepID=UPI00200D2223|nr:restriction endonuclease subunit S [Pseudomonas moorei]
MSELPKGWADCVLEDLLGELANGKILQQGWSPQCESSPATEGEWGVLKTTAVQDGYFLEVENKKLPLRLSPKPEIEVKAGDLLMTCAGPRSRCGVICYVDSTREKLIFSGKIYRFRPNQHYVSPKFLTHLLRTSELKGKIDNIKTGISESGMNMTRDRFFSLQVRLAPLNEQNRIAQELDELLAQVNTIKARIDTIPVLLKRFRRSLLAAAVSGRLTAEWRAKRSDFKQLNLSNLPAWTQTVFGDICREITVGYVGKMADQYRDNGVPFLRSQNVRPMRFSPENILYISEEFHASTFKSRLEPGDLAIVRSGAPGVTCVIPDSLPVSNCSDLVIARPSERLNSWFGCLYMNSEIAQHNVAENQVGVAQQHFNVGSMKKMPINLPPIEEQLEIVRRVEQLFAFADQLEAKVASAKTRIDHLTQSILAKAFRGELVPQDPNDEPASVLLERIKAQRAAAPKAKRGRKASA